MTATPSEANDSPLNPRQSRRDRWATLLAAMIAATHLLAGMILLGWYYYLVPRVKRDIDDFGVEVPQSTISVIGMSDVIINYWYLLVMLAPISLILDFIVARWTAKQIGLRFTIAYGLAITFLFLANLAISQYILNDTKARLLNLQE